VQIEFISSAAITMMHLSRLAEELVLWSSEEWQFVEIGEAFTTGSSIMPQKRNPDIAELLRGKTGRVYGHLVALLTVMKGLPLAYNRDMQEDKLPLIDSARTLEESLHVAAGMIRTLRFRAARFEEELEGSPALATELADYLVRKGVPFREAHSAAGAAVRQAAERGTALRDLPLAAYRRLSPGFEKDLFALLSARRSLYAKRSEGSTSPTSVARAIARWERRLRS
jgi:argininosuccinate lyase